MNCLKCRSWIELIVLILTIPIVMSLFHFIEERRVAAVVAGVLFTAVGGLQVFLEVKYGRGVRSTLFWNACIFLAGSAFPILGLRLANWDTAFDQTSLFGIPGPSFHLVSNWIYLAMIVTAIIEVLRDCRPGARVKN